MTEAKDVPEILSESVEVIAKIESLPSPAVY